MNSNIIDIKRKSYVCPNCQASNHRCRNCGNIMVEDNFYLWLALTKLKEFDEIILRFTSNFGNKGAKIANLLSKSVGLQESKTGVKKEDCTKLELRCECGNTVRIFTQKADAKEEEYTCTKCNKNKLKILSREPAKIEKMEIVLEKLPAVKAAT